jgi:hypothetical protein
VIADELAAFRKFSPHCIEKKFLCQRSIRACVVVRRTVAPRAVRISTSATRSFWSPPAFLLRSFAGTRKPAPDGVFPRFFPAAQLYAPLALQLHIRYLTGGKYRVRILLAPKNLSRSFPHGKIFCASMPPVTF